jgi:hypothetical protein
MKLEVRPEYIVIIGFSGKEKNNPDECRDCRKKTPSKDTID